MKTEMVKRLEKEMKENNVEAAIVICCLASQRPIPDPWRDKLVSRLCSGCDREILASKPTIEMESIAKLLCKNCAELYSVGRNTNTVMTKEALEDYCKRTGETPEQAKRGLEHYGKIAGHGPLYKEGSI